MDISWLIFWIHNYMRNRHVLNINKKVYQHVLHCCTLLMRGVIIIYAYSKNHAILSSRFYFDIPKQRIKPSNKKRKWDNRFPSENQRSVLLRLLLLTKSSKEHGFGMLSQYNALKVGEQNYFGCSVNMIEKLHENCLKDTIRKNTYGHFQI